MGFETGAGEFMQAGSYSAAQLRRSVFGWAARTSANTPGLISGGLLSATDMQLSNAVSGLVVYTSVGECLIGGTEATSQGGYHGFLSSQNSTTLATANASNPRIDLICATVGDAAYTLPSGATSGAVTIQAVTGTPTSGATLTNLSGAPTLPASSLLLGYVLVPAAATSLTNADIKNVATQVQFQPTVPGQLLATHQYAPGTTTTYTLGAYAAVDTTNATLAFTVPPSGNVDVDAQVDWTISATNSSGSDIVLGLGNHSGGAQLGSSLSLIQLVNAVANEYAGTTKLRWHLTGLTPGALQVDLYAYGGGVGTVTQLVANSVTGGGTGGPLLMQAFAA